MRPVTVRWPKPVLPIDGRPVLATLLHELRRAGCERVWVVTGHLAEHVEQLVGDGSAFGVEGMVANGWEWTSTVLAPFDGFEPMASYPQY